MNSWSRTQGLSSAVQAYSLHTPRLGGIPTLGKTVTGPAVFGRSRMPREGVQRRREKTHTSVLYCLHRGRLRKSSRLRIRGVDICPGSASFRLARRGEAAQAASARSTVLGTTGHHGRKSSCLSRYRYEVEYATYTQGDQACRHRHTGHATPRNSDGNPDSPQAVVFLTSVVDVTVGY